MYSATLVCTAFLPLCSIYCDVSILPTKVNFFINIGNRRLKDLDVMSAIPSLDTEMANLPHLTEVHAQHMPQNSDLPVQSPIEQQFPQPYQASSHPPQQQYAYQYPAQQPITNTTLAQPNTGAGIPIITDVKPSLEQADDQPWR